MFAVSFTGSAALEFGYDLDKKDYGFANKASTELKFGFELGSGEGGSAGEKDLRAEIAGEFKVEFKEATYKTKSGITAQVTTLEITKANILYKDILTVGMLGAGSSADYVSSYNTASADIKDGGEVVVKKGKTVSNLITALANDERDFLPGFTVEAYGVKGGFGLSGKADDTKAYHVLAHAALVDKELAEGFKLSVGAGALLEGNKDTNSSTLQANLKGAYSQDKLSASLAVDFQTVLEKDQDAKVGFEASAAASYDFVSLNAYFYLMDKENAILDAKVAANKTFEIDENVSVKVTGSFEANNVADKTRNAKDYTEQNGGAQEFTPALDASCTVDKFTFGAGASYGIKAKALAVNGSVKYAPEEFTAEVKAVFKKTIEVEKSNVLTLEASISSDKVIDGATLSLAYAGSKNLLKDQTTAQTLGKITAGATVKF